jgi:hypothetical protein
MKTGHDALGTAENESHSAKHEIVRDALGTAENESGSAKHENWSIHRTVENEFGSAKLENGTRRPRDRQKRVRGRKT